MKTKAQTRKKTSSLNVLPALRRAARDARKIARFYGTPIYIERNGKVVAIKP